MRPIATPLLDQLLAGGVINAQQHERAVKRLAGRPAEPYANLGEGLAWLMAEKIVFLQEVARLQAAPDARKPVDPAVVAQTLAEWESATQRQQETRRQAEKAKRAAQRPLSVVPPPAAALASTATRKAAGKTASRGFAAQRGAGWRGWLRKGVYGAIAAGIAYWLFSPDSPMDCDNDRVWRNVGSILTTAQSRDVSVMMNPSKRVDWFWAQPTHIEQIGYARSERTRACRGTLVAPTRTAEVAFTISPNEKGDFYIKLANPKILQARYGQSENGQGGGKAAPIGPVRIKQVFMDAATSFEDSIAALASVRRMEEMRRQRSGQPPGSTTPVRDVVPLGDCKPQGRDVWTCRLVVEYRDRLIGAVGGGDYQVLEGEFDFEPSGSSWRAANNFPKQFAQAVLQARMEAAGITPPEQDGDTSITVDAPSMPRRDARDRAAEREREAERARAAQDAADAAADASAAVSDAVRDAAAASEDPSSWPDTIKPPQDTVAEPEPIEAPRPTIYEPRPAQREPAMPVPVPMPVPPVGPPPLELTMPTIPAPPRVQPLDVPPVPDPVVPIQIDPPKLAPIDVAPAPLTEPRRQRDRERESNDAPRDRLRPGGG